MGPTVLLALVALNVFLWVAFQRAFHPFEIEWMEGGSLQHLHRVLSGAPLYPAPSLDFVPFPYPPFYYYVAALVSKLVGANLLALRLVSILATMACGLVIFYWVHHESRRWDLGAVCAGLFFATYRISGAYMDVGRIDSLFVALCLAAVCLLRTRDDAVGFATAGALAFLATLTKQTGLAVFFPLMLWSLYRDSTTFVPKGFRFLRTLCFTGTTLGLLLCATAVLSAGENGHFFFYILGAQSGHEIRWALLPYFFWNDFIYALPLAVVAVGLWVWRSKDRLSLLFYFAFFAGTVAMWIVPRAKVGGAMNNLIPLHACLVVLLGVALGRLLEWQRDRPQVLPVVALALGLQYFWLVFDPTVALPRASDSEAGVRLVARLESTEGEVLIPAHGYLAGMAGKQVFAHQMAIDDLSRSDLPGERELKREFEEAIAAQRFSLIVDSTSRFLEGYPNDHVLKENYRVMGPVFQERGTLVPRSGWQVGPGRVWVPVLKFD